MTPVLQTAAVNLRIVMDIAIHHGLPPASLLAGLGVTEEAIRKGSPRRHPWDVYAEMLDRLCDHVGGFDEVQFVGERVPSVFPEGVAMASAFVSPRLLYLFANRVLEPKLFPMFDITIEDDSPSTMLLTWELQPGYRESKAFFYASLGLTRMVPTVIGLPKAVVDPIEISGSRGVYRIHLPPSRTLLTRARKTALSKFRDEALKEMERDKFELVENFERMKRVVDDLEAREAALAREVEARAHLQASLTKVLDSVSNAAFLVKSGSVEGANETGTAALARDGEHLVAEVLAVADRGSADGFDVARISTTGELLVIRKGLGDEISRRLAHASSRWGLTPRQSEVLRGLVDGLKNGEIAERLGCTARTVEVHVTSLLDRADATSRLQLVAAFWGDVS